jgi:transcriptional regulator with XRE-family HTH domain
MELANNIKTIREDKNLMQKEVASYIGVDKSTYSKIEKGLREVTVAELKKIAQLFDISLDELVNYNGGLPQAVVIEDENATQQLRLIQQLEEDDKHTIFKLVDKMLTNKRFQDFFAQNLAIAQ